MVAAALAARVVEVIADLGATAGDRYRYGSGCIVRGKTVLTAAHVVAGAVSVVVRDTGKREYAATVDSRFVGEVDGRGPDLALLEIDDPAFGPGLPPIGLAVVDRDSASGEPVERCHAVGYPWFAETPSRIAVRDTVDALGIVPVLSKLAAGLLNVQVSVAPQELPPRETALAASPWSGMSGAPVFAAGYLLGVVTEHAPREGPSAITAVPLTALQADVAHPGWGSGVADPAAWWARLGVEGTGGLQRLPAPPPPQPAPPYRATLREFGWALHQRMPQLLGREQELRQIADFATSSEGYRWLVGGAFTGKSALLYEAVTVGLPDEVDVVCYFLSRRASDATGNGFLAAVVPQLAYLCEVDPPDANVHEYHALWEQAVQRGRHLLLVVDGLDEDLLPPLSPSVASLLPGRGGGHAHVLVASRPMPMLPDLGSGEHPLNTTRPTALSPFAGAQQMAERARHEIRDLTHGDGADLAVDVLGVLTAAAGPLSVRDLAALRSGGQRAPTAADRHRVRQLVKERAARSLEQVGPADDEGYQFAHSSLLEYAQADEDLRDPEYRQRIHHWAQRWRDAGWPAPAGGEEGTPRYLLETYPATLAQDPQRLAQLVSDVGWVEAAVQSVGVDRVLADLRPAAAVNPAGRTVAAVLAAVIGQAYNLRPPQLVDQPGYILRQLWMQAAELAEDSLAEDSLADDIRGRLQSLPGPGLVPQWTTRRASRALSSELGRHYGPVNAVAVLPDGRVVTGGGDGQVLVWDPAEPATGPFELGSHHLGSRRYWVNAVAVLPDGRVVTGGDDGRMVIWDPAAPGARPTARRTHDWVKAVAVLPDGRVVTGGKRVLMWDPAARRADPIELGTHDDWVNPVLPDGRLVHGSSVNTVAVLPDGRVVSPAVEDVHRVME